MTSPSHKRATGDRLGTVPLVLIVDDNDKNRKLAREVLRAAGFGTLEAPGATKRSPLRPSAAQT